MLNNIHLNPFAISGLLTVLVCIVLITVVLVSRRAKMHFLFSLAAFSTGLWGLGSFFIGINKEEVFSLSLWKFSYSAVILIPIFFLHFVISFVDKSYKKILIFAYLQGVFFLILILNDVLFSSTRTLFNSIIWIVPTKFYLVSFLVWIYLVCHSYYILFKFYPIMNKEKASQIQFFLIASFIAFSGGITDFLPSLGINIYPYGNFLVPIAFIFYTFSIFHHQFMDIKIVFKKSIVYSVLVTLITATYFIFVFLAEKFFQGMVGYTSLIISIFYAFTIALFFIPVKNRIQHLADKIFLGKAPIQIAQENELMKQELERAERLKAVAHFASGMAHEIKNPLTAIKTFAEYLPEKRNDPEFLNKFSKIVSGEVGRIDSLVHQLLDFAKPAPLQLQNVDIHSLLDDTLGLLSNEFIKHNIKIEKKYFLNADLRESNADTRRSVICDNPRVPHIVNTEAGSRPPISDNVGAICEHLRLKGDPNKLKQAFLNLFLNSIDAMPSGGTLTVSTSIEHRESSIADSILISISDTGCGIPDKDLHHIFEPFYSTKEQGTGLGLSIVYNIIKEHSGSVKVESKINKGTRFLIRI